MIWQNYVSENYSPKEALPERNLKICDCHLGSFIKRQTSVHRVVQRVTTNDNEWQRVVQRVTTNDNEWQPVVQVTTSDNEWQQVVQRVTTSDNRWHRLTRSDNEWQFWLNFLFSNNMVLVWGTIVVFLKLSTSYLLFIIKMCFFFFDEKHVLFCITKRRSQLTISLTCYVIK